MSINLVTCFTDQVTGITTCSPTMAMNVLIIGEIIVIILIAALFLWLGLRKGA